MCEDGGNIECEHGGTIEYGGNIDSEHGGTIEE